MADRDIPSVPVTTLAGLTSLSDLLSELPIAESTHQTFNKSLLFHPRVVEEANNLLATRDDQLAQQLVKALRQTNADNIELRDEYAVATNNAQCSGLPNDNSVPELLQTVFQYDENVFHFQLLQQHMQQQHHFQNPHSQFSNEPQRQNMVSNENCAFQQQKQQQQQAYHVPDNDFQHPISYSVQQTQHQPISPQLQHNPQSALVIASQQHQNPQQNLPQDNTQQIFSPAAMIQQENNYLTTNHWPLDDSASPEKFNHHPQQSVQSHMMQSILAPQIQESTPQKVAQKPPRNTEFLQQPQQRPSPTQASIAPETSHISQQNAIKSAVSTPQSISKPAQAIQAHTKPLMVGMLEALKNSSTLIQKPEEEVTTQKILVIPAKPKEIANEEIDIDQVDAKFKLKLPVISLKAISNEDSTLLQNDLKSFIKNEPEKAAQLGVSTADTFSRIKAEEMRILKRRSDERIDKIVSKPKLRRVEKKLAPVVQKLSPEELMKTSNYQRFMQFMQQILDELDETEAVVSLEDDDNPDCITTQLLQSIGAEAQKLKARNAINALPENKLTLLINYAMRSIAIAKNISAGPDVQDDLDDDALLKIVNAAEAALLICNIYTCKGTKFLQEDNIDTIIKFVQFQLRETIFPSYDPVYTFETKKKVEKKKSKYKVHQQQKEISQIYHKIVELTKVLVQMYNKFHFVDTITIHASALGVEPFFVDNIETLQFVCLDLVTSIFQNEKYAAHRKNILAEILTSVDRLPHSKRNLRPFKLTNNGGNIQMMTALVLQLIQCSVVLPETFSDNPSKKTTHSNHNVDRDTYIYAKYETAVSIGGNFLTTFLNKCKSRSGETDFRPLFENFIHDLLTTVNRPEWPASELLLSLLGTLLVKYMSDKSIDQSIRVVSLEYLGTVAAKLRKDTVDSRCRVGTMDQLITMIKEEQEKEGENVNINSQLKLDEEEERTEFLQRILLDYLAVNEQEDNITWSHAKHFYLTLWYRDISKLKRQIRDGAKGYASRKKPSRKKRRISDDESNGQTSLSEDDDKDSPQKRHGKDEELQRQIFLALDHRKKYLLNKIGCSQANLEADDIKTYLDYNNAHLIAQYLAGKRPFSQSFDMYLQKIILVVREPSIAIRTKAMKCLSNIVEVDQCILARKDMQIGVAQKLLDTAISVREAAVDLIGKYILSDVELVDQYYDMLSQRILDTGVSVRKRVIKILRDICIEFPAHEKIPDICVKMIRRVNDEEGIQKLVMDVFMTMWFTPCNANDQDAMDRKINQIIDVVCSVNEKGSCGLDDLLKIIFEPKENKDDAKAKKEIPKTTIKACQQIVDGLVNATMTLEGSTNQTKLVGCITALHLFAKVRPQLLINHAETLEPYLNVKTNSSNLVQFISSIAEILEQVVPLMDHPSESFLNNLEAHLMMLVFSNKQLTVTSCISSLAAIVNKITKNYNLIRDCFKRFYYKSLLPSRRKLESEPNFPLAKIFIPTFRRSIFTVGLLMRHFDFKNSVIYGSGSDDSLPSNICTEVFETFAFFFKCDNIDLRRQTLIALGHFCVQNYEFMTKSELRDVYLFLLSEAGVQNDIKIQVLKNILIYLTEEEQIMVRRDKDWQSQSKNEDLKEMGDVSSGMASAIIQVYLSEILHCFLHRVYEVRFWAMKVIEIVLRQGLIHPIKIVPYLICLSTDPEKEVAHAIDRHLQEIDKQYPGFVNMKSYDGLHLSYTLQNTLQRTANNCIVRGFRAKEKGEPPSALNGFLYSLLRNTKPTRRALIQSIIKQFDEQKISLHQMLYLADNLAYFPYIVQDEPLYLVHQIDLLISNAGTNLLCIFREGLKPNPALQNKPEELPDVLLDEDDEEDIDALYERLPEETTELEKCVTSAQGCMLLLILKQHLKDNYGITDSKISRYTPSDTTKIYDKAMQRRSNTIFNPKATISVLKEQRNVDEIIDEKGKRQLISRYLEFKQLMLKLDPADSDSDVDERPSQRDSNKQKNSVNVNNTHPLPQIVDFEASIPMTTVETGSTIKLNRKTTNKSQSKKQAPAKKRRKRKATTSEEESDYSDDYD